MDRLTATKELLDRCIRRPNEQYAYSRCEVCNTAFWDREEHRFGCKVLEWREALRGQSLSQEAARDEALEERFWVVEAVNEDDTVLSPPAYWYGGFVGSTVAGHVGSDIHAICTRFQNAQTAEYVKCLLRNAKIPPDRGHHWKIFKHVIALKREPNAAARDRSTERASGERTSAGTSPSPAPAAPELEVETQFSIAKRGPKYEFEIDGKWPVVACPDPQECRRANRCLNEPPCGKFNAMTGASDA